MTEATDTPKVARRRRRWTLWGLMLLVGVIGLAMGVGQFWWANQDPHRAAISQALRTLTDPEASVMAKRTAIDMVRSAQGRQARHALKALTAILDDPNPNVRAEAASTLGGIGRKLLSASDGLSADTVRSAVLALVETLDDPENIVGQGSGSGAVFDPASGHRCGEARPLHKGNLAGRSGDRRPPPSCRGRVE